MLTQVPLVGWTARGGLPVSFTLSHNSQSKRITPSPGEIAQKWIGSYDVTLAVASDNSVTVTWGDEQSYKFTFLDYSGSTAQYLASGGFNDTLVGNGSGSNPTPTTSFDLTTTDQVKYHFTLVSSTSNPPTSLWHLTTITDQHGSSIAIGYNASNQVSLITDPNSRTLTLGYVSNQLKTVQDCFPTIAQPNGRVWTLNYSGGELTSITYPTVYEYPIPEQAAKPT